ncbi:MAG: acylphosphatase [Candidatus Yonathbacteria bacterium]|nr:acylphosphatase [Candidatus Yonathbacteria bacterium]
MRQRLECEIFGRVQLVMFRDFVCRNAHARGIVGTVKNNPDGSVSVRAEGEEKKLQKLSFLLNRGPFFARVDRVEEKWADALGEFNNFDILY